MTVPFLHRVARVRSVGMELAMIAGHVLLYPTGMAAEAAREPERSSPNPSTDPSPRPPVLLVHGLVDNRSVFTVLRRSLLRHGWPQVCALNYSPLTLDVRRAAAVLGERVRELTERSDTSRVDVIGHSLGGLVARYYVQRLDGDQRVRTLVTLGTPHTGTTAGPLLDAHPMVRQMRPDSDLMRELAAPAPGCRTRFVAIWSDMDQVISPVEAARLHHPDLDARNVLVPGIGHLTMPVHGAVTAGVRRALLAAERTPGTFEAA
ncbi:lipase [Wenjunlia vitaminophila]|uniref:Lipase n=1 Tax=Wenjunlia vitaminophila TaxID=76728 RepID=A0A0T6LLT2_WENVI|nr:alpha/beta fold hydrolase [Wenjunlia vitaminophila]KRV46865.1 lipase [Wenjunlia vitaminophila]